jgi:hypothetical protein
MSSLFRAILSFENPTKLDMLHLSNLIFRSTTLIDQQIYIAKPRTEFLHYSNTRLENLKLTQSLSLNEISPEFLIRFKQDYAKFKIEVDAFHKSQNKKIDN